MLKKVFKITLFLAMVLALAQKAGAQDTIPLNTFHSFEVSSHFNYTYSWWFEDTFGNRTEFTSKNNFTEDYFWDTAGDFELFVQAADENGCLSEIISKPFVVTEVEGFIPSLVALPDMNVGYENTFITGDVSINDLNFSKQNKDVVYTLTGETLPGLVFNDDGTYEYNPSPDFTGTVGFSYRLCYAGLEEECALADVAVHILPVETDGNMAPVAATDVGLAFPDQTIFGNMVANDIDPDGFGAPLTISVAPVSEPSNGSAVIHADGSFAYTPNPGFVGIDRFLYRVCDSGSPAMCDSAWVYVIVSNFGGDGQKPVSASDDMFLHVDGAVYSLRDNDSGLPGEDLEYDTSPVIPPGHGTLELFPNGTFTYLPEEGYVGVDWFVYSVCNTDEPPVCSQGTGFILITPGNQLIELAGRDTIIGNCNPYILNALEVGDGFNYAWEPGTLLDDSASRTPVFTPGETTVFKLTVSNQYGFKYIDSVRVEVSQVLSVAGDDAFMYAGESAVLDGAASQGLELQYFWRTENGIIDSGEATANPVVSGFGSYILEVTDKFGCFDTDTVNVGLLTHSPVAQDDYDTTEYRNSVKIYVLDNDFDPDNDIDSMSLAVTLQPLHGSVNTDYTDFSIRYTPGQNYHGTDHFEYRICDLTGNCGEASVFVLVNDFRFFIPDAFSPNNDGINDYFEIRGIDFYEGNSIEIFNRWGNRVYKAENYGINTSPKFWDGKSNTGVRLGNENLPTGTYFYVLNLGNGEKRIVGSVYLDR